MVVKTRKHGNSIIVTVPKEFEVGEDVRMEPKMTENGILYEFVEENQFDFDTKILESLIDEGYHGEQLLMEFKKRKQEVPRIFKEIAEETLATQNPITKKELEKELGL